VQLSGAKTKHYTYADDHRYLMVKCNNSDGSSDICYEYIWLDDLPVAQVFGTYTSGGVTLKTTYIHADHLNTPRMMTSTTNVVVWRWVADGFGYNAPVTDPDGNGTNDYLNLRFPGQIYDSETGFNYNLFRDYDPSTGRYLQSDPIGLQGGLNTYGYVGTNPTRFVDPNGLFAGDPAAYSVGAAAGATTASGVLRIALGIVSFALTPQRTSDDPPIYPEPTNNIIPFPMPKNEPDPNLNYCPIGTGGGKDCKFTGLAGVSLSGLYGSTIQCQYLCPRKGLKFYTANVPFRSLNPVFLCPARRPESFLCRIVKCWKKNS
jgi:RHS repeat-associated protein